MLLREENAPFDFFTMTTKCVFIGGKQLGVNCLGQLLKRKIIPKLVVGNLDDHGRDMWHESLVRVAEAEGLSTVKNTKINDAIAIKKIKGTHPDIIFCIGSTQIIPKDILVIPKLGCLNIHPALLPKYRGRFSTAYAIFNGEKYTGVTLHWMDEGIDSGPIIMQERIEINSDDTAKSLYDKFTAVGEKMFVKFINMLLSGEKIESASQDESQATYFPKKLPNKGEIDWAWDGKKIRNFIRAMTFEPFPPASIMIGKKKMVIVDEKYFKGFG